MNWHITDHVVTSLYVTGQSSTGIIARYVMILIASHKMTGKIPGRHYGTLPGHGLTRARQCTAQPGTAWHGTAWHGTA